MDSANCSWPSAKRLASWARVRLMAHWFWARVSTRLSSSALAGERESLRDWLKRAKCAASSPGRMMVWAVHPCFNALRDERDLPASVRGPVDLAALARLAASCASESFFILGIPRSYDAGEDVASEGWGLGKGAWALGFRGENKSSRGVTGSNPGTRWRNFWLGARNADGGGARRSVSWHSSSRYVCATRGFAVPLPIHRFQLLHFLFGAIGTDLIYLK